LKQHSWRKENGITTAKSSVFVVLGDKIGDSNGSYPAIKNM
jgi:hypothetical protein